MPLTVKRNKEDCVQVCLGGSQEEGKRDGRQRERETHLFSWQQQKLADVTHQTANPKAEVGNLDHSLPHSPPSKVPLLHGPHRALVVLGVMHMSICQSMGPFTTST
jgi:hypothetical protein